MTQADGTWPTAAEVRASMREVRPALDQLMPALETLARIPENATLARRWAALVAVSQAHAKLCETTAALEEALGLPYDPIIENVTYTAIFGPED